MTHIPFQHSYTKGGSRVSEGAVRGSDDAAGATANVAGGRASTTNAASATSATSATPVATLSYSDSSSSMSTESFPSDTSCSSDEDIEAGDFMMDSPSDLNSCQYTEVSHEQTWVQSEYGIRLRLFFI